MLPPELLYHIFEQLKEDRETVLLLCRIDTGTYRMLIPEIYRTVVLVKPTTITSFCRTVSTSPRPLNKLVQSLQIGYLQSYLFHSADNRLRKNVVPDLRTILSMLPSLRDLSLGLTPAALNVCLNTLRPNFFLERLACTCVGSGALWSFLRSQSSITTLELSGEHPPDRFIFTIPADILPNLRTIKGSMDMLTPLARLRPVSHITITGYGSWFSSADLVAGLTEAPVESITCIEWDPQSIWVGLLLRISTGPIPASLKRWTIFDWSTGGTLRRRLLPDSVLELLSHFKVLEEFTIVRAGEGVDDSSTPDTRTWLGEMAQPESWRRMIKSLRVVTIYELDLI